jgi:hypothetical protein
MRRRRRRRRRNCDKGMGRRRRIKNEKPPKEEESENMEKYTRNAKNNFTYLRVTINGVWIGEWIY